MTNENIDIIPPKPRMGRPTKYKNEETEIQLKELVYEYKKLHPFSGLLRISHMVRFSERMHKENPEKYPLAFSKDVWGSYGKKYIEQANEPIPSALLKEVPLDIEIPNITDLTMKYHHNINKLLEHLQPIEVMLHESLSREQQHKSKVSELEDELSQLKNRIKELQETINSYEKFTLEMAQLSYISEFRIKYGLVNQISIHANDRNKHAMTNLNNLESLFPYSKKEDESTPLRTKESAALTKWKERRKQQEERQE
ncbi:hypothetical protein [Paenibacillus alginolyticus]|uniref:Uncharacterized protein n=1 Tax=Paenibacillus alginolyticus TaxID=59839 RepID=A0ABT4GEP9_9BACL|nr:hypothetical protein [Paenibacillus alginolyticus]MCY9694548.1 hypothetical protein [Paenibacillus alginolyticus]MEC0142709.1 hypothetical protein [Paenibacillus alginolyticus]